MRGKTPEVIGKITIKNWRSNNQLISLARRKITEKRTKSV
jgi:hypothetical protein